MSENKFKDNVVIITGASGGLGQELAFNLAQQGAWLSLAARDAKRLEEVEQKCREFGARAMIVQTDVTKEDECKRLIDKTMEEYGRIDTLINNAGFSMKNRFEDLTDLKSFKSAIDVNLFGSVYCTRFALPHLKKTKGRIIGVCSVLGKIATPGNTAYCSSKFAMAAFFDALRLELIDAKVSVTMIYPGYLAEKMLSPDKTGPSKQKNKLFSIFMIRAKTCAKIIIKAAARRKRQVIKPFYCVICVWLNLIMPGLLDQIVRIVGKIRKESP